MKYGKINRLGKGFYFQSTEIEIEVKYALPSTD